MAGSAVDYTRSAEARHVRRSGGFLEIHPVGQRRTSCFSIKCFRRNIYFVCPCQHSKLVIDFEVSKKCYILQTNIFLKFPILWKYYTPTPRMARSLKRLIATDHPFTESASLDAVQRLFRGHRRPHSDEERRSPSVRLGPQRIIHVFLSAVYAQTPGMGVPQVAQRWLFRWTSRMK